MTHRREGWGALVRSLLHVAWGLASGGEGGGIGSCLSIYEIESGSFLFPSFIFVKSQSKVKVFFFFTNLNLTTVPRLGVELIE